MKKVKAKVELINPTIINGNDVLKKIESIARVCYKSEDAINEGSAAKMISFLINRGHEAMLEHFSYTFTCTQEVYADFVETLNHWYDTGFEPMLRRTNISLPLISGNIRAWRDFIKLYIRTNEKLPTFMDWIFKDTEDLKILFGDLRDQVTVDKSGGFFEKLIVPLENFYANEIGVHFDLTIKFVTDRGVSHEIVRHRRASFAQESTRYCSYASGKFGNEITVLDPKDSLFDSCPDAYPAWENACSLAQRSYMVLSSLGAKPQEARSVLPNSTKTEIVMTANAHEWKHFLSLRALDASGVAHPQMHEIAIPALKMLGENYPTIFGNLASFL